MTICIFASTSVVPRLEQHCCPRRLHLWTEVGWIFLSFLVAFPCLRLFRRLVRSLAIIHRMARVSKCVNWLKVHFEVQRFLVVFFLSFFLTAGSLYDHPWRAPSYHVWIKLQGAIGGAVWLWRRSPHVEPLFPKDHWHLRLVTTKWPESRQVQFADNSS